MNDNHGFVLVNALVLVAALAAAALFLLSRAESGRVRLEAGLETEQLTLALDAYEALALTLLMQDANPAVDHNGESWARTDQKLALARGQVAGRITDQQGLFNINWLADPENIVAQQAFDRLLIRLGIPASTGPAIRDFLSAGGPADKDAYLRQHPPLNPVGGTILMLNQLETIPNLSPRTLTRLRPFIAALPGDSRINVNTAAPEIMAAFLPDTTPAQLNSVLANRDTNPFTSVESFLVALGISAAETDEPVEEAASLDPDKLSVGSDWFGLKIAAELGDHSATRQTLIQRFARPAGPAIAWRVSERP